MLGLVGLQDRPAGPLAAPGPADRLAEQLVGPLGGALVGQVEGDVGRHDPDQRDGRHVEALGDEARPDEDVVPPAANASMTRSAAPRRSATSRSSRADAQRRDGRARTSRSTRSVPPPR